MEHHGDHIHHTSNTPIYWIIWGVSFVFTHVAGIINWVSDRLPEVELPVHEIRYLPQLNELLPAVVTACACGLASAIVVRSFGFLWRKFYQWVKLKFKKS